MKLHNVRSSLESILKSADLTQVQFARKYGLSYSWINKFLMGHQDNPRLNSLIKLQDAIDRERRSVANRKRQLQDARVTVAG